MTAVDQNGGKRAPTSFLVCRRLPPLELLPGARTLIGREEDADFILPGNMVSREHAVVTCQEGQYFLEDLGSRNGTSLNGTRVTRRMPLSDGDIITVGGFAIQFQVGPAPRRFQAGEDGEGDDREVTVQVGSDAAEGILTGRLGEVSIVEVLQLLHQNARSGEISIRIGAQEAMIGVIGGAIVHATYGEVQGKKAVLDLALLDQGSFAFQPCETELSRNVPEPTEVIMMEAVYAMKARARRKRPLSD